MDWQKNNLILKATDTPQERKKKLNAYFFLILGFLTITELWPLLIIAIFMYQPLIKMIEKDLLKKMPTENKPADTIAPVDKHADANLKNTVQVDTNRSTIAIVGFIIFILVVVVYYYIKLNS